MSAPDGNDIPEQEFRDCGWTLAARDFPLTETGFMARCQYNNIPPEKAPRAWWFAPNEYVWNQLESGKSEAERKMTDHSKVMEKLRKKLQPKGWDAAHGEGAMIVPDLVKVPKKKKGKK